MPIFKGFNIEYPSYSVITPQSGETFDVRCLTVSEVNELKHAGIIPSRASTVLNSVIWKAIKSKPDHIKTFEDFLNYVTINDRASIVYGIYHSTFGDIKEFSLTCSSCGNTTPPNMKFSLDKMVRFNPYPQSPNFQSSQKMAEAIEGTTEDQKEFLKQEGVKYVEDDNTLISTIENKANKEVKQEIQNQLVDILSKKVEKTLPISKIKVYIQQPTLKDESDLFDKMAFNNYEELDHVLQTLVINKFAYDSPSDGLIVVDGRDDIVTGYNSLPPQDRDIITDTYMEEFGKYRIDVGSKWICRNCQNENNFNINIVQQFFRLVQSN